MPKIPVPRYTVVLHEARADLGLSLTEYVVVDCIHRLASANERYPYCTLTKEAMAKFLMLGTATVYRAIKKCLKIGILEKTPEGFLKATAKWTRSVEVYSAKTL